MKRPLAWLLGAVALFGFLRRRHEPPVEAEGDASDPRADELRRKLAEERAGEPETEIESEPHVPDDPETRRREVHESARETVEQMRRGR